MNLFIYIHVYINKYIYIYDLFNKEDDHKSGIFV